MTPTLVAIGDSPVSNSAEACGLIFVCAPPARFCFDAAAFIRCLGPYNSRRAIDVCEDHQYCRVRFGRGSVHGVPTAQAKTKKYRGTFKSSGEAIDVIADFSFDGSTTNSAALNTFWTTDSLGDVGPGQSVSEYSFDSSAACTFKGLSGTTESGGTLTLVGAAGAGHSFGGPLFGTHFLWVAQELAASAIPLAISRELKQIFLWAAQARTRTPPEVTPTRSLA